jgi:type IV secretion system protein VirB1
MEENVRPSTTLNAVSDSAKQFYAPTVVASLCVGWLMCASAPSAAEVRIDSATFRSLADTCSPAVHPVTASALVAVESGFNPNAIGVVNGALDRQPRNRAEAITTAKALDAGGWSYSVGLAQINSRNFAQLNLSASSAFDPCANLRAMQLVLSDCLERAEGSPQTALRRALSCYYSGNSESGFHTGYVARVVASARRSGAPVLRANRRIP